MGSKRRENRAFKRHMIAGLVYALDWFDNSLQAILSDRGLPTVHRTQSMILVHVASGIRRPIEIAREMGVTRQNVHHMAKPLIEVGIIEQVGDAKDGRSSIYRFTSRSSAVRRAARAALRYLEVELARRIGARAVGALKQALAADWGPEITAAPIARVEVRNGRSRKS